MKEVKKEVKEYYGKTLQESDDLKTNACCCSDNIPKYIKEILSQIEDEVLTKYYGCGSPIPPAVEGCTSLDLGSGSGRDVYTFSKLVGENGKAIGIDMTDEQLAVANKYIDSHTKIFGYKKSNVEFIKGDIEDLKTAGIADNSIDIITSNCVINLAEDKEKVFSEIFRVLKPGGELYFSDVFCDRRLPKEISTDPIMYGECLGGTLYYEDFRRIMTQLGCASYCEVSSSPITIENKEIEEKVGDASFYSVTIRAFKIDKLEDRHEDYGQIATYNGGMPECPDSFIFEDGVVFEKGEALEIPKNYALMLSESRYGKYFTVSEEIEHIGLFDYIEDDCCEEIVEDSCFDNESCCEEPVEKEEVSSCAPGCCC